MKAHSLIPISRFESASVIKYYGVRTCYDGHIQFSAGPPTKNLKKRYYPDEFLIAAILQKYIEKRLPTSKIKNQNSIVLTEDWADEEKNSRSGNVNINLNSLLLDQLYKLADKDNVLLLTPFLYHYHHPGFAIVHNNQNKKAVFIDPKGEQNPYYSFANYLDIGTPPFETVTAELSKLGYTFSVIDQMQQDADDATSCGPMLTFTMMQMIEQYIATGNVSELGFEAPRKKLATDRLFQMYVQNTVHTKSVNSNIVIQECMFADVELMAQFFEELPAFTIPQQNEIFELIELQKKLIRTFATPENYSNYEPTIRFFLFLQSKITELVFLSKLKTRAELDDQIIKLLELNDLEIPVELQLEDLFLPNNFSEVQNILRNKMQPELTQIPDAQALGEDKEEVKFDPKPIPDAPALEEEKEGKNPKFKTAKLPVLNPKNSFRNELKSYEAMRVKKSEW